MKKNKLNLLIVGATSGIMNACLQNFINKKYNIFASYAGKKSILLINKKVKQSKNIKFFKLDLTISQDKIYKILKKNKIKADIIINAVGGSFGIKNYPYKLKEWNKSLDLNILKHIAINNFFLKTMTNKKFGRILFFSSSAVDDPNSSITYSTSKAFLENYVKKSSILFGKHNVLINCIKTSIIAAKNNNWYKAKINNPKKVKKIEEKFMSVKKIGTPEDLIDLINLTIDSKNKFLNGSIIKADGGIKFL